MRPAREWIRRGWRWRDDISVASPVEIGRSAEAMVGKCRSAYDSVILDPDGSGKKGRSTSTQRDQPGVRPE